MMRAAVIGHPVSHSKSPLIHNYWIRQYGLEGSYEAIDVSCEKLESEARRLIAEGYNGFNVTVPHKENILALCDAVDETAKMIGAVNTVVIKDKKLRGTNTDAFGFLENLKAARPGFDLSGKKAVILGAGGAARAALAGLLGENIGSVTIANRTAQKSEKILEHFKDKRIKAVPWERREAALEGAGLLINTTSLGMKSMNPLEISLEKLPPEALVCDIVYNPLKTGLLKAASARGNKTVTGIGMLLHQARPAFRAWTGIMPEVTRELEDLVLK